MDENDVQITRNKKLLEEVRQHDNNAKDDGNGRYSGYREESNRRDTPGVAAGAQGVARGHSGSNETLGPPQTVQQRVRPSNRTNVNAAQSPRPDNGGSKEPGLEPKARPRFHNPLSDLQSEPVKLFTQEEADDALENMTFIYLKLFELPDDLLEIIVKDHEEVKIWALDEDEAETLAQNHLKRAKVDQGAARSARKLLEVYDRLYFYMIIWPRLKATGDHVKEHRGFSFK